MRWAATVAIAILGLLGACDKQGGTNRPGGSTRDLEKMEGSPTAGTLATTPAATPDAKAKAALPSVRDRDPEEEKRKMAASRAKSAQAEKLLASGQLDQAVMQSREALKIHEQNVDAMLVIAEVFYRQGKFELTLAVTNSALAVDAKVRTPQQTSRVHDMRGFAHAAMGNGYAATEAFKKAAEADEKNAAAWNNLGTRYLDAGDAKTALSCFTYALELRPSFAKAHMNLGAAYRAQRDWKKAEASMLKALKLRQNYPEVYFNLGLLYLDADPFPGLDTNARLTRAIDYLGKYKAMAAPSDPANAAEEGGRDRRVRGKPGAKPGPAPVSHDRADDYIRVAQKGLEREKRRLDREKKRQSGGSDDEGDAARPQKPGAAHPDAPQTPTDADEPATPSEQPKQPKPPKPSQPSQPSQPPKPQGPTQPAKPQEPAQPTKPQSPTPQKPAPQRPTPQRPGGGAAQKSAAAWNPLHDADTKADGLA